MAIALLCYSVYFDITLVPFTICNKYRSIFTKITVFWDMTQCSSEWICFLQIHRNIYVPSVELQYINKLSGVINSSSQMQPHSQNKYFTYPKVQPAYFKGSSFGRSKAGQPY